MSKNNTNKFSPELRERAVRLVQEHQGEYPSLWLATESIAPKIGCTAQILLNWVKRHEIDNGQRPGLTTAEQQRIKELERENKELRRAQATYYDPWFYDPGPYRGYGPYWGPYGGGGMVIIQRGGNGGH